MSKQAGIGKIGAMVILLLVAVGVWLLVGGEEVKKAVTLKTMEVVGNIAIRSMPDDVAGGFHKIPVEVKALAPDVYQASGIANTHMIVTSEGNVLFDTGIAIQAAQHVRLLKEVSDAPIKYIILSHSHADHIGGAQFWREDDTVLVAHREFAEEQRYLIELTPFQWRRNRILFPWMPEEPATNKLLAYKKVETSVDVDEADYRFILGRTVFEVLSTPGAEGADNISLWLPQKKILFSGDTLGPLFPQFPNVFTMRGEKVRAPIEYINSLNKLIALDIEMLVPSHHSAITGKENIRAGLTLIRDATQYVHDETIKGMNEGKTVYALMAEIKLPPELALTQEHGKVSWAVRSIWDYYATWFHFESTTELYPVPVRDVYAELAQMAGPEALVAKALQHWQNHELMKTLHILEVVLAAEPNNKAALNIRLDTLNALLEEAKAGDDNNYEKDYLRRRIAITEETLAGG